MKQKRVIVVLLAVCLLVMSALPIVALTPFDPTVGEIQKAVGGSIGSDTPGAAVVLLKNGTVAMVDGFGYADLDTRAVVTPDTVFEIGDLSALFTAASALLLSKEGRLELDADIATYLPEELMADLALSYPVTTRQLLTGYAGFGGKVLDIYFGKESYCFESLEEALLTDMPEQVTVPGTVCAYSRYGIALAALVIERASGMAYTGYVTERLLTPLGMTNTSLTANTASQNLAVGYRVTQSGVFVTPSGEYRSYSGLYPATGALSTARDMAAFFGWLFFGEGSQLVGADSLLFGAPLGANNPIAMVLDRCGTVCSRSAATRFFGASFACDFQKGEAMLVLTNTAQNTLLSLPQTAFAGAPHPLPLPEGELLDAKGLAGMYLSVNGEVRTLVGRLQTIREGVAVGANEDGTIEFGGKRLTQIARGVFADADGDISLPVLQFLLNEAGEVTAMVTHDGQSYTPLPFYYSPVPAMLLFGAVAMIAAYFVLAGVFFLIRYRADQHHERKISFFSLLPDLFAGLLGVLVLIQLLVAVNWGAAVISSFYYAMQILALLTAIAGVALYVLAFVLTVFNRKRHKRIAYTAILLLVFFFLVCFLGFTVM